MVLEVKNLSKRYSPESPWALAAISLNLAAGEILALVGPSGGGKTTLLRLLAGLEIPDQGEIYIAGARVSWPGGALLPERRGVGMVFQDYALFPHLSVAENVAFGLRGLTKLERDQRVHELLGSVGLADLGRRRPSQLSGGQQQRVAIARALAPRPRILLLDEPFASLDAGLRAQARAEVKRLVASYEVATILVTHDQEEALAFADRIGIISAGQLVQEGSPRQVYREPKSAFVAGFLGGANLVKARAHGLAADSPLGEILLQSYAEGFVELALRPEHLRLQPDPAGAARVLSREFYGHDLSYRVQLAGEVYQVKTGYATWLEPGTSVNLLVAEPAAVLAESAL